MIYCGLDFGTSNSTAGGALDNRIQLTPLENESLLLPSVLFFDLEHKKEYVGSQAIDLYLNGTQGRFLRSLKSLLGSSLIYEKTFLSDRYVSLEDILVSFLTYIYKKLEENFQTDIAGVTIGRPVFFVDGDSKKDLEAQKQLEKIAKRAGFKNISFYFEPLAAALHYTQTIQKNETALIMDIGGGTADFSIVELGQKNTVLSNSGVHFGGTNIDTAISLHTLMPLLGFKKNITPDLKTPNSIYYDLSTGHLIQNLYTLKERRKLEDLRNINPTFTELKRLQKVITNERGHDLLFKSENMKIDLSNHETTTANLDFIEENLKASLSLSDFEKLLQDGLIAFQKSITETLNQATLKPEKIDTIFLTGGTTKIPFIKKTLISQFPHAKIVDNNTFYSVGEGLTLKAQENQ